MTKLNELKLTNSIILLAYAAPGIGKTFLSGSAGSRNVIITDLNGIVTLKNPVFRKQFPNVDPFVEVIKSDEDPSQAKAYDMMSTRINHWFEERLNDFDTITIDDVDFLRSSAMNRAVSINSSEGRSQTKSKIKNMGIVLPTMADFGTEMGLVEGFLSNLTSVCRIYNKNLIVNAHERMIYKKNKDTREDVLEKVVPHFTGKSAPEAIGDYFDLVFRITRVGKGDTAFKKTFQCHPDDKVAAKDRYGVFKTYEDNLSFPDILARIEKNIPENTIQE